MSKIKAATGDSVKNVFDAISEESSQRIAAAAIAPSGGKIVLVLSTKPGATDRKDVQFIGASFLPVIAGMFRVADVSRVVLQRPSSTPRSDVRSHGLHRSTQYRWTTAHIWFSSSRRSLASSRRGW